MRKRREISHLQEKVMSLNQVTKNNVHGWSTLDNGVTCANTGNYHLWGTDGCVSLRRMVNACGFVKEIFPSCSNAKLYDLIEAFISGYQSGDDKEVPIV